MVGWRYTDGRMEIHSWADRDTRADGDTQLGGWRDADGQMVTHTGGLKEMDTPSYRVALSRQKKFGEG